MTTASPSSTAPATSTPFAATVFVAHHPGNIAKPEFVALCDSGADNSRRELRRVNLSSRLRRADPAIQGDPIRQPLWLVRTYMPVDLSRPGRAAIGGQAAITPVLAYLLREPGMEGKAAARGAISAACHRTNRAPGSRPTCRTLRREAPLGSID